MGAFPPLSEPWGTLFLQKNYIESNWFDNYITIEILNNTNMFGKQSNHFQNYQNLIFSRNLVLFKCSVYTRLGFKVACNTSRASLIDIREPFWIFVGHLGFLTEILNICLSKIQDGHSWVVLGLVKLGCDNNQLKL